MPRWNNRETDEVTHEYDGFDCHRLIVNGEPGEWFHYTKVAINGDYFGTSDYFNGSGLPEVFTAEYTEGSDVLEATKRQDDLSEVPKVKGN